MADFLLAKAQYWNLAIVETYQVAIPVDIDFLPFNRVCFAIKCHQCFTHGVAQMAFFAIK